MSKSSKIKSSKWNFLTPPLKTSSLNKKLNKSKPNSPNKTSVELFSPMNKLTFDKNNNQGSSCNKITFNHLLYSQTINLTNLKTLKISIKKNLSLQWMKSFNVEWIMQTSKGKELICKERMSCRWSMNNFVCHNFSRKDSCSSKFLKHKHCKCPFKSR